MRLKAGSEAECIIASSRAHPGRQVDHRMKVGGMMYISRKQLIALFVCTLILWTAGNGLLPLLPVYAESLGADSVVAGLYLAGSYVAIAAGALSASWISGSRLGRKRTLFIGGLLGAPLAWLLGSVSSMWALTLVTALLWFLGGMGLALAMILTGLSAGKEERGKIFGIIALTCGLGSVIGGLGTGWLVKGWGFPTMFSVVAVFMLSGPVSVLFLEEKKDQKTDAEEDHRPQAVPLGRYYSLLFWASLVISIGNFVLILIRSLSMLALGFDALAISSTGVVGGLISLPLPFLMGWLSDRFNRKAVLIFGYLTIILALIMLALSTQLWHFWLVSFLAGIGVGSNGSAGNALVTDLVARPSLGKGLSLFGATGWIGGIIVFALGGLMLQKMDFSLCCYIAGVIGLAAIGLLLPIRAAGARVARGETGPTN